MPPAPFAAVFALLPRLVRLPALLVILLAPAASSRLLAAGPADAPAVSRTAPGIHALRAAPLLTPLSEILAAAKTPALEKDAVARVLIDESIHLVDEEGRIVRIRQVAYQVLSEAGVNPLGEDLFAYDRDRQKFHLVRAVAIQPDGTEQAVADDAVLLQSPQRQADLAIYDDTTEVRVIYPRISVGSITHCVTVTEDISARMPGAYTARLIWGARWPTSFERVVVELPPVLAARLRWFSLGPDADEPVRETLPDGRLRLVWRRESIAVQRHEVGRAPASQTGPALHLTTLASWDEVAAWFQNELAGRDRLPPALAAEADDWLRAAPDRDAILRILFAKVADDVRYVSLALGEGDYRPQSCADVWTRRHGDCKDKSNLLVALLRHAGIPAHIALLNTSHLGLIDRRAPDYRVFSHAIVALPDARGGYTFCDPTLSCATPGLLAPGDADRDVLVVREGRAEWARTPPQSAGRLDYAFDLSLNPAGELSGWLTLAADGLYGAWERDRYRDLDQPSRREMIARLVRGFFPGAEIIDFTIPDPAASAAPALVRAYFLVPGQGDAATGPSALRFPRASGLFLDLGSTEQRDTAYFLYQGEIRVSATIALPPGVSPDSPPADFLVESPTGLASARWSSAPGSVRTELHLTLRQSALPPREFPRFYQAMLALQSWLNQPLPLRVTTPSQPAAPAPGPVVTIDLPLMPTGAGQLELIEKRYPFAGDRLLRRAALQRAIQYFPNDAATAFEAGVYLAVLDWNDDKNQPALDRVLALLATHRAAVPPALVAWAESLQGLILRDLGRPDEALPLFLRIARDPALGAWRRSIDALNAAALLSARDPSAAADLLSACAPLVSEKQPALLALLARLLLELDRDSALREHLASLARAQPSELDGLLAHVTDQSAAWDGAAAPALRARWLALAATLAPTPDGELAAALARADAADRALAASAALVERLREAVAPPPLAAWLATPPDAAPTSWDAYETSRRALVDNNRADASVRLGVRALLALPADDATLERLWRVAADADWHERRAGVSDYPILTLLLDLCDRIPPTHAMYFEGSFLRGDRLSRRADHAGEHALFAAVLAAPALPPSFKLPAHARFGGACENIGDLPAALAAYRALEGGVADSAQNADRILRAVLINLHLEQADEALRLVGLLETVGEPVLRQTTGEDYIREFIALRRSGRAATFWAARGEWWMRWQKIAANLRLPPPALETSIPLIPDLTTLGQTLRQAEADNDPAAHWREFRTLVSAARWLPSLAPEVSAAQARATRMAPAQSAALRRFVLTLLVVPGVPAENAGLRGFHIVATLFDSGDHAGALEAVAAFRRAHSLDDPQNPAVNRVWAMAALAAKRELAEASAALVHDLASPDDLDQRARAVELLADLHRARGLGDEEARLLERELADPLLAADQELFKRLQTRKDRLDAGLRLAAQTRSWLGRHPLPWYDHARPASLDDPRLQDLDAVLKDPGPRFSAGETIKLRLLVAQDPRGGFERQSDAFLKTVTDLHRQAPTHALAARIAGSVVDEPGFDEPLRALFLWRLLIDSYDKRPADFERWNTHPLASRFSPSQVAFAEGFARLLATDQDSPAALADLARRTTASELHPAEVGLLQEILKNYLRLDELEAARALADTIPDWRFAADYTGTHEAIALPFARTLRVAQGLAPVHRALVARVREAFPRLPEEAPAAYAERRHNGEWIDLSPALTRETGLWMIGARRFRRDSFIFWPRFIRALYQDPATQALSLDLVAIALHSAPDDAGRIRLLDGLLQAVDQDDPATRARLDALLAPYDNPARPLTANYLRLRKLHLALRLGEPVDLEKALAGLPEPGEASVTIALRHYRRLGDLAALKRTLDAIDQKELLKPALLIETLPALELVGYKTEARLARDSATRELRTMILEAWMTGASAGIDRALDLALTLGSPSPFPPGWIADVTALCPDPLRRGRLRLVDAWLRADWTHSADEAVALVRDYPTHYRLHWYAGAALHRSGRVAEARPYLETYVRHAKNEPDHSAAIELLK